jgi:hypothetical protein
MRHEEYILKHKKRNGINESDLASRAENVRIRVNYVFEYFKKKDSNTYWCILGFTVLWAIQNAGTSMSKRYQPDCCNRASSIIVE